MDGSAPNKRKRETISVAVPSSHEHLKAELKQYVQTETTKINEEIKRRVNEMNDEIDRRINEIERMEKMEVEKEGSENFGETMSISKVGGTGLNLYKRKDVSFPAGWEGGFKYSKPKYEYGRTLPDLSDLKITGNLDNIKKITRTQKILWPEFSWQSIPGDDSSRVYEMFAKDVSRIGYDDKGRIWSLICPQRGVFIPSVGTLMIEVTVTGIRGWVDEPNRSIFGNVGIQGNIWIEPSDNDMINELKKAVEMNLSKYGADAKNLPFSKANAIKMKAHAVGKPYEEFWPVQNGTDPTFYHPPFTQHWDESFSVYHLEVEMGKPISTGNPLLDDFNMMLIELFNLMSGNLVSEGQRVAWNVWTGDPEIVDTKEWEEHAEKWFHSLTVKHEYPEGDPGVARYADGTLFRPKFEIESAFGIIGKFVSKYWKVLMATVDEDKPSPLRFFNNFLIRKKGQELGEKNKEDEEEEKKKVD